MRQESKRESVIVKFGSIYLRVFSGEIIALPVWMDDEELRLSANSVRDCGADETRCRQCTHSWRWSLKNAVRANLP